jgi:hypothetical protein
MFPSTRHLSSIRMSNSIRLEIIETRLNLDIKKQYSSNSTTYYCNVDFVFNNKIFCKSIYIVLLQELPETIDYKIDN